TDCCEPCREGLAAPRKRRHSDPHPRQVHLRHHARSARTDGRERSNGQSGGRALRSHTGKRPATEADRDRTEASAAIKGRKAAGLTQGCEEQTSVHRDIMADLGAEGEAKLRGIKSTDIDDRFAKIACRKRGM